MLGTVSLILFVRTYFFMITSLSEKTVETDELLSSLDPANLLALSAMPDLPLARAWMCEQLRASGISVDVVKAMSFIPRHGFSPPERWRVAYVDQDIWTGLTWMMAPRTTARIIDALPRRHSNRILEIGTGTGYQTALLMAMNIQVVSIDISLAGVTYARMRLHALGATGVRVFCDNALSPILLDVNVKFDCIVVDAAITATPVTLFKFLKPEGGVVIAPTIMSDGSQRLLRYEISENSTIRAAELGPCKYQPIIPGGGVAAKTLTT